MTQMMQGAVFRLLRLLTTDAHRNQLQELSQQRMAVQAYCAH